MTELQTTGLEKVLHATTFSATKTITFNVACQDAVNEAIQDSGFDGIPVLQAPEYWSESKATAYYFRQLGGVGFAGGAVCLDIGAGTTDITVISGFPDGIIYHTSLQFAGRYLFQSIYKHYNIFAPTLNRNGMELESRDALIDADVRKNSENYQTYVGGNGLRIFPWNCGGTFTTENPYIEVLKDMLVDTSGLSANGFRIILSNTPKVEVARGMTENRPHHDATFFNQRQIATDIFGEERGRDPVIANSVFADDDFVIGERTPASTNVSLPTCPGRLTSYALSRKNLTGVRISGRRKSI